MKINITLNGVIVSREIPTKWEDVNYRQFLELEQCKNDFVKVMALFTGIEPEILSKAKIENLDTIIRATAFIFTQPKQEIPKTILGFPIPKDLGLESIAQFEDIKSTLKDSKDMELLQHLHNYPLYCAIYSCKPYDWKKAEEMKEKFYLAPCQEVLGIGNFTLAKLIGLNLNTVLKSPPRNTLLKKLRLALTVFRLRLDFMVRSFFWRRKQEHLVKNS